MAFLFNTPAAMATLGTLGIYLSGMEYEHEDSDLCLESEDAMAPNDQDDYSPHKLRLHRPMLAYLYNDDVEMLRMREYGALYSALPLSSFYFK